MYIQFTKDLNKIKNSVFLGMGVREIIIAVITLALALLEFFKFRKYLLGDLVYYFMLPTVMLGTFFMFYKKNGIIFEKVILYKLKRLLFSANVRRYETEKIKEKSGNGNKTIKIQKTQACQHQKNKKQSA